MSALPVQDIFNALHDAGLSVSLVPGGGLAVSPGSRLTPDLRYLIRNNKDTLVNWLHEANDPAAEVPDLNSWCWPHSQAMNTTEISAMAKRTDLFHRCGLTALEAELLADKLLTRDREGDDRRLCSECEHLSGRAGTMRCSKWQRAGLGQPGIPTVMVQQFQRCGGFSEQT